MFLEVTTETKSSSKIILKQKLLSVNLIDPNTVWKLEFHSAIDIFREINFTENLSGKMMFELPSLIPINLFQCFLKRSFFAE